MMKLAESYSILHCRYALWIYIRNNVSGIQKFKMPQSATSALFSVCLENSLPKAFLVQTLAHYRCYVRSPRLRSRIRNDARLNVHRVISRYFEGELVRVVSDDKDRPNGKILARDNAVEIDQRHLVSHRGSQPVIVPMVRIGTTITIEQKAIFTETVIVWTGGSGSDRERHFRQYLGLEDALRSNKGYAFPFEFEALFQQGSGQNFAMHFGLFGKPIKGS